MCLQMHYHGGQYWIVVSGTARAIKSENTFLISEMLPVNISFSAVDSPESPGKVYLGLIEVQSDGITEGDIVRFNNLHKILS